MAKIEVNILENSKLNKEDCIKLIRERYIDLGRLPKKSDFTENQVVMIKSYFGPWPRALESAGVKEKTNSDKAQRLLNKRIRTKIRKREYKISNKKVNEE